MAREKREASKTKMDMTPMIDVVFQMIIFFILTMTISSKDIKPVQLPTALTAVEEDPGDKAYLLHLYSDAAASNANIIPPVDSWYVTVPDNDNSFRDVDSLAAQLKEKVKTVGVNDKGNSELQIVVRGDMRAPSHYFAVILGACQEARVFKIQLSIKPPPEALAGGK